MEPRRLLIVGASGYIGGTFLVTLLQTSDWSKRFDVTVLVRSEAHAAKFEQMGVRSIMFSGLDDLEFLTSTAEQYDIILNSTSSQHTQAALALIRGLGLRESRTQSKVHFLHISGTSALSDHPLTAGHVESRTFSDGEDIYSYEKYRESINSYAVRVTDIGIVKTGEACGVHTHIVMAPFIFGVGTGPFGRTTVAIKMLYEIIKQGRCVVINEGKGVWSRLHVSDLADLLLVMVHRLTEGQEIPYGRKGIFFCDSGMYTGAEAAEMIATAGNELGLLPTNNVESVSLEEGAALLTFGIVPIAEMAFVGNSRTKGLLGRNLGWAPKRDTEWHTTFKQELTAYIVDTGNSGTLKPLATLGKRDD